MGLTSHEQQFQDIRLHLVMVHPLVFTNQADARYAPIEGKCLGAARAMKCQYFLLAEEEVENPRLQRLKEKTLKVQLLTRARSWKTPQDSRRDLQTAGG